MLFNLHFVFTIITLINLNNFKYPTKTRLCCVHRLIKITSYQISFRSQHAEINGNRKLAAISFVILGRVRLGSIRNKNNWNNASKRLFGSYSYSRIPGFHSGYSAPRSRIAGIYFGIHSYSGIFLNERALSFPIGSYC